MTQPTEKEWDLAAFVSLVKAKLGTHQAEAITPTLGSIAAKFGFCHFHAEQAIQLMRPHKKDLSNHFQQVADNMRRFFHTDAAEQQKMMKDLFAARAHTLAFAQCLHSTADYLAKVVYHGLDLPNRFGINIPGYQIGLEKVMNKISQKPDLVDVTGAIRAYLDDTAFNYLAAFVNTEKHHELVQADYSFSFEVGSIPSAGIRIREVQYDGKHGMENYPKKWVSDFFEADFKTVRERTVDIGAALAGAVEKMT